MCKVQDENSSAVSVHYSIVTDIQILCSVINGDFSLRVESVLMLNSFG